MIPALVPRPDQVISLTRMMERKRLPAQLQHQARNHHLDRTRIQLLTHRQDRTRIHRQDRTRIQLLTRRQDRTRIQLLTQRQGLRLRHHRQQRRRRQ